MSYELGALHHPRARGRMYRVARPMPMRSGPIKPGRPTTWTFQPSSSPRSPFLGIRAHQYGALHAAYSAAPPMSDTAPMPVELAPGLSGLAFVRRPRRAAPARRREPAAVRAFMRSRRFGGPATLELSPGLEGLGFSLKPPKAIRKAFKSVKKAVTLKNVLKVGAVVAGAALVPGALPLLAKGAVGVGKLALGAGKLGVSAVRGAAGLAARNIGSAAGILTGRGAAQPAPALEPEPVSPQEVQQAAAEPIQPMPAAPLEPAAPTVLPQQAAGGTSYALAPYSEESEATAQEPTKAGMGGGALALAGLAVVVLIAASRRRR